jgi:predicted glycosyltransferase
MKIAVDINHPKDVNIFKNFIWEMEKRGHEILITASRKDVSFNLLDNLGFSYEKLGSYGDTLPKKIVNILPMDIKMYWAAKKFNPDIFLGFGSIRAAHVSKILGKPCIALDDTEHAAWEHRLYVPFTDVILTPNCFKKDFGKKQIRYNGYTELAYLHPNYFKPNPSVLDELGLGEHEKFVMMRFVDWQAGHDFGHKGLTSDVKLKAVKEFEKFGRVFISSENPLQKEFEKYRISNFIDKMHHLLYYATLMYGESSTMASESAVLGTHAIYNDFEGRGYTTDEEKKYNLVYNFRLDPASQDSSVEKGVELLKIPNLKEKGREKRAQLVNDHIDVSKFLVGFIEDYPNSARSCTTPEPFKHL